MLIFYSFNTYIKFNKTKNKTTRLNKPKTAHHGYGFMFLNADLKFNEPIEV